MSATTAIARGRRAHEKLMVDRCIIDRETGTAWDEDLGRKVPVYGTILHDDVVTPGMGGICTLRDADSVRLDSQGLHIEGLVLSVPVSAVTYEVGDRVRMTYSEMDPALPGTVLTITELDKGTHLTARQMKVAEVPL